MFTKVAEDNLTVVGAPMPIYHDEEFWTLSNDSELAVAIKEKREDKRIFVDGKCAMVLYKDSYTNLSNVYAMLTKWIEEHGKKIRSASYEIYLNDPQTGILPEDYLTKVCFPIV